jgi:6-phosphofructokinase 1
MKSAVVAMGGGPTRVINRSLFGVVDEASKHGIEVLAARHGIMGVLNEKFEPISAGKPPLSDHKALPGAVIGSTRHKPTTDDCAKAFQIFKKLDIHYFFYIGGNDTAQVTSIINREAKTAGYELRCFHVPKTIDNDLVDNDHCPGYGSAARFVAHALVGDDLDVKSLPGVKIDIIMGRKAGWLTAATALCRCSEEDGPHLQYFPERAKSLDDIITEILATYDKYGKCIVAMSEGVHGPDNAEFVLSDYVRNELSREPYSAIMGLLDGYLAIENASGGLKKDAFGHVQLSGTGTLADVMSAAVKIGSYKAYGKAVRCRADTFGYLQRSYAGDISPVDAEEAEMVGRCAVAYAVEKDTDGSVSLRADRSGGKYRAFTELISLEAVAGLERYLPEEFINADGNGVTPAFLDYARPLVGELVR